MAPTMRLLAIDPGPVKSAWLVWDSAVDRITHPTNKGIVLNAEMLNLIHIARGGCDAVAIEKVASYGMPVGAEVFETVFWSGRFAQMAHPIPVYRPTRAAIKMHICHSMKANDASIRQALIDRFSTSEQAAIGLKASPGPLYGVTADIWSALAVAVTIADKPPLGLTE
jgi:hypothetical protein